MSSDHQDDLQLEIRAVEASDSAALQALFRETDVPCYCQYWQYPGDHREWQNRCANEREENSRALAEQLNKGAISGFVALQRDQVVGWARLEHPSKMSKLYGGRLYRGLPCLDGNREKIRAIACFLVHPSVRRRGVAASLLTQMQKYARQAQLEALEAFPRGASDVSDEEQWMGPLVMFAEAGFSTIRDFGPYPVLRWEVGQQDELPRLSR